MNENLKDRTKNFAIGCWRLCAKFSKGREYDAFCRQLIRCSSSVGANYRAACRAKSTADFINKLKIVEEEADESMYFLEILKEVDGNYIEDIDILYKEANELLSIIVASIKTTRKRNSKIVTQK